MSKKIVKEWNVDAPWGKIAVISWGNPKNPPILLVHGFMDSAATFMILVDRLPDQYYYVAFDMPGHGKSDPLPSGMHANQLHLVEPLRIIVKHLGWQTFIYMAHSMGCIVGLFYNEIFPNKIQKMILIDPAVPLSQYFIVHYRQPEYYTSKIQDYYDNYQQTNSGKPRLHTLEKAISLVVRNRSLTEEQAEVLLSRALVPMGIDTYKLSWEPRMKKLFEQTMPVETLYTILTHLPPTLCIDASEFIVKSNLKKSFINNLLHKCDLILPTFFRVTVTGAHDIHITNADALAQEAVDFLEGFRIFTKSKL